MARRTYQGLRGTGPAWECSFTSYLSRALAAIPAGSTGALVLVRGIDSPHIAWADMVCPTIAPRPTRMRALVRVAGCFHGIEYVAVDLENSGRPEVSRKMCESVGLQRITETLYSIRVGA